jgi:hypothetical protein
LTEPAFQLGEQFGEQVFAAQVGDGALLDLAVVAIGFDDADVLVNRTTGGPDLDSSQVQVVKYHDGTRQYQGENRENIPVIALILSLHFSEKATCTARQTPENRRNPRGAGLAEGDFTPNMG